MARSSRSLVVALLCAASLRAGAQSTDPAQVGQWTKVRAWPSATHVHLLPSGEVMFFGEFESGDSSHLWNPVTGKLRALPKAGYNIFCGGHSFLGDGTLLVAGGHADSHVGLPQASLFDPASRKWTRLPDMNDRRWYPTSTTLANGDALVISGETVQAQVTNDLPQVLDAKTLTWRSLTTAVMELPYYPREFVAPNGSVFVAGPKPDTWYLDTAGTGAWTFVANTEYGALRDYGPAVLYGPGKVLYVGGGDPPTATSEVIDLGARAPRWRMVAPMSVPRRQHNATILPDGKVLVTGGSSGAGFNNRDAPVFAVEVWDPEVEGWMEWASMPAYRGYHSAALLLPDGRILSAGGRGAVDYTMEVFSPPYLFRGARPRIESAPAAIDLGEPFVVGTPDAARVSKVSLIRLGSVTHAFDENQRFVPLDFTAGADGVTVRAPAANELAPPGHYMLFLVDDAGVPSVATIVQLSTRPYVPPADPGASPGAPPPPASSPPPVAVGSDSAPGAGAQATSHASSGGCSSTRALWALAGLPVGLLLSRRRRWSAHAVGSSAGTSSRSGPRER